MIKHLALAAAFLIAACATNPTEAKIEPGSGNVLVVVKVPKIPASYRLSAVRYNQEAAQIELMSGGFALATNGTVLDADERSNYIIAIAQPGIHAFQMLTQQERWGVCYHADSLQFELTADTVVYLGEFDPTPSLSELTINVVKNRDTYSVGRTDISHYFENISPPNIAAPSEQDLDDVRAFIDRELVNVNAPVMTPDYAPASFGTGRDLFGLNKICGGYYRGEAKPKDRN